MNQGARERFANYFCSSKRRSIQLSFEEIEKIFGETLPRNAYKKVWWANDPTNEVAKCWMNNGYRVAKISDSHPKHVVFNKVLSKPINLAIKVLVGAVFLFVLGLFAFNLAYPNTTITLHASVSPIKPDNTRNYMHYEYGFDSFSLTRESMGFEFFVGGTTDNPYTLYINSTEAGQRKSSGFIDLDLTEPNKYAASTEFGAFETVKMTFYKPTAVICKPMNDALSFIHKGVASQIIKSAEGYVLAWEPPDNYEGAYCVIRCRASDSLDSLIKYTNKPLYDFADEDLQWLNVVSATRPFDIPLEDMDVMAIVSGNTYKIDKYSESYRYLVSDMDDSFGKISLIVTGEYGENTSYGGDASPYEKNQVTVPYFQIFDDSESEFGNIDFRINGSDSSRGFRFFFFVDPSISAPGSPAAKIEIISHDFTTNEDVIVETYEAENNVSVEYWGGLFSWIGQDAKFLTSAEYYFDEVGIESMFKDMYGNPLSQTIELSTETAREIRFIGSGEVTQIRAGVQSANRFDDNLVEAIGIPERSLELVETTGDGLSYLTIVGEVKDIKIDGISIKPSLFDYIWSYGLWAVVPLSLSFFLNALVGYLRRNNAQKLARRKM